MSFPARRRAGVLAHPTSLPGPAGIGDLGPCARRFLDWLDRAGIGVWQVLPLGPVGGGGSPYDSPSTFAGSPLLISLEELAADGWLDHDDPAPGVGREDASVDFGEVIPWKRARLQRAWTRYRAEASAAQLREFEAFIEEPARSSWLSDWSRFAAASEAFGTRDWTLWPASLRDRREQAWRRFERDHSEALAYHRWVQFQFHLQWESLHAEASRREITLFGDLPYYVAHQGAEVWSRRDLFAVDGDGRALRIGGVPPDYFSDDGQLWGNPVYDWAALEREGFDWWIERIRGALGRVDLLRLDHFRGFAGYWEVPAGAATARDGSWTPGPGRKLFDAARARLGELPLVAEDLGEITEDVEQLLAELELPGMRVLQFALGDEDRHRPERHPERAVAYTGTHDNDTLSGWLGSLNEDERRRAERLAGDGQQGCGKRLIRRLLVSPARLAVLPLQDLLGLGSEARMNRPGVATGNWGWRVDRDALDDGLADRVRTEIERSGRLELPETAQEEREPA